MTRPLKDTAPARPPLNVPPGAPRPAHRPGGRRRPPADATDDVAQQRTEVVVLGTATGDLVRRAEVTGLVLGQALTK